EADEETLRSQFIAEALDSDNSDAFSSPDERDAFARSIAGASFQGLTPSQATGVVLYLYAVTKTRGQSQTAGDLYAAAQKDNLTFAAHLHEVYTVPEA